MWAQMVGIIAPTGRLSQWATVLNALSPNRNLRDFNTCNPFELSAMEQVLFVQMLFYHDQVLPILIEHLGRLPPGSRIGVAESCRLIAQSLGEFLDHIQQAGPEGLKMRLALRSTLEKIAQELGLRDRHVLVNAHLRREIFDLPTGGPRSRSRVLHAERQAVCRFEQLTDLGLLTKDDPTNPPTSEVEIRKARTSWIWYTTKRLPEAVDVLRGCSDLEVFLRKQWIGYCSVGLPKASGLKPVTEPSQLARFLDQALPVVRRQIGPIQVHPWATLACVFATEAGVRFELDDVHELLVRLHADPRTSDAVRLGGTESFRGRNVVVPAEGLSSVIGLLAEA